MLQGAFTSKTFDNFPLAIILSDWEDRTYIISFYTVFKYSHVVMERRNALMRKSCPYFCKAFDPLVYMTFIRCYVLEKV